MGISLTTFMRQADICSLKLSANLEKDLLKKVIGKSLNQKGHIKAARLQWDVGNYDLLRQLIHKARELAIKNWGCPYVLSHDFEQKRLGNNKEHIAQVLPRTLIAMFDEARKNAGFAGDNPPTFHSIRSLAIALATEAGYTRRSIQVASAHSSERIQDVYTEGHSLPFEQVDIQFTADQIGGSFK